MPAKWFICPDKRQVEIAQCLDKCSHQEGRCLSLPTLTIIGEQREWTETPSTTMLLNGTRQTYLEITRDFTIDPFGHAFMLLGTRHHTILEKVAKRLEMIAEEKLTGEISGILDLLVPADNGNLELWDYKTWGSYKVEKILQGEDLHDTELQLNHYRIKIEALGVPITRLVVQATVRDGGTFIAKKRGLDKNIYLIPINRLDDFEVAEYFASKAHQLASHLADSTLPDMCSYDERWGGNKCLGYCPVAEYCPEGAMVNKVEYKP